MSDKNEVDFKKKYFSDDAIEELNKKKIKEAIALLRGNGYVVKKLTTGQLTDMKECEECDWEGECMDCRCSICIVQ